MEQVRDGSAATTFVVRAALQGPQASLAALSRELGINYKALTQSTVPDSGPAKTEDSHPLDRVWCDLSF